MATETLFTRLLDPKLTPKTRRANLAALAQWAKYAADGELTRDLMDIRLPPANRSKPKRELEFEDWRSLLAVLSDDSIERKWSGLSGRSKYTRDQIPRGIRYLLLIVGTRGLRIGDALRIKREDIGNALSSGGKFSFIAKGNKRLEYDQASIEPYLRALYEIEGWTVARELVIDHETSERALNTKMRRALRVCARKAKVVDVYPHRLRRTYATHFVRRLQNDPQALIKLTKHMGWSNIATAAQYVDNVNQEELDKLGSDLVADVMRKAPKKR